MTKWKSFKRKTFIKKRKWIYRLKIPNSPDMYFYSKKEFENWIRMFIGKKKYADEIIKEIYTSKKGSKHTRLVKIKNGEEIGIRHKGKRIAGIMIIPR